MFAHTVLFVAWFWFLDVPIISFDVLKTLLLPWSPLLSRLVLGGVGVSGYPASYWTMVPVFFEYQVIGVPRYRDNALAGYRDNAVAGSLGLDFHFS